MRVPRHHIFVCTGPHCGEKGSAALMSAFRLAAEQEGIDADVMVTNMGSVYLCDIGPVVLVYPDDVWYTHMRPEDCPQVVREHLKGGKPVERLRLLPSTLEEKARQDVYRELFQAGRMDAAGFEQAARRHGFDTAWVEGQLKTRFLNRGADGTITPTAKMKERYGV